MTRCLRSWLALALISFVLSPLAAPGAQAPTGSTTVILVRHAEKDAEPAQWRAAER